MSSQDGNPKLNAVAMVRRTAFYAYESMDIHVSQVSEFGMIELTEQLSHLIMSNDKTRRCGSLEFDNKKYSVFVFNRKVIAISNEYFPY